MQSFRTLVGLTEDLDKLEKSPQLISDYMDYVVDLLIVPYTSLTREQIDEVDTTDIFAILKHLIELNGLTEKVRNFLITGAREVRQEIAVFQGVIREITAFQGAIPTTTP